MFNRLKNTKRPAIILLILMFVVCITFAIITVISPLIMLANEDVFLKQQLKNPYIDSDFEGWNWIEVENFGDCLFPSQWRVKEEYSILYITDMDGNQIAAGTVLDAPDSSYQSREAFLSKILCFEVTSVEEEYNTAFVGIDMSHLGTATTIGESENTYLFFRLKKYESPELFFVFLNDRCKCTEDILDIAQAMAYAYRFKIQKT